MNKASISIQIIAQGRGKDDDDREGWGQGGGRAGGSDCGMRSLNWAGLEIHAGLLVVLCKLGLQV